MTHIAIIGGGGREHALGWKIGQHEYVTQVFYLPGNGGTKEDKGINVPIDGTKEKNFNAVFDFIKSKRIDQVIVGPEQPLADGLVDYLLSEGYGNVFGPTEEMARLESDKFYSFDVMTSLHIPQATSFACSSKSGIEQIIREGVKIPVLKARGLHAGKGVRVYDSKNDALKDLNDFIKNFGEEVLVSERLYGEEFSVFGLADGHQLLGIEMAFQDHKPLLDGDKGPNTGGMGAFGPADHVAPPEVVKYVIENIMNPIVEATKYKGFLYAGMMKTDEGLKVIEFNARFGDPEAQPAMMMLEDIYEPIFLALEDKLSEAKFKLKPGAACCVVLASNGYPGDYSKMLGKPIYGLSGEEYKGLDGRITKVFHAGTDTSIIGGRERVITSGGRILGVTSYSPKDIIWARGDAYGSVYAIIDINKVNKNDIFHFRNDIADKALK
jgi:phosphoribosylamine---glycine ligase